MSARAPKRRPLDLIHQDERWVAVDKPAGIPVHGGAGKTGPSVIERLQDELGAKLHLVHRLDRATQGVLLLSRDPRDAAWLSERWPAVEKSYGAIVSGHPAAPRRFDRALRDPDGRAKPARTRLTSARSLGGVFSASVCSLHLETGRLHQIRRHLAEAGHPVLMDPKYGDFEKNRSFAEAVRAAGGPRPKHLLLWCRSLRFPELEGAPPPLASDLPRIWRAILDLTDLSVDDIQGLT
ncbi:MAG: RluA family pseudouridine synthase [Myxococcota bacterium]